MRLFWTLVLKEARGVLRDKQNLVGVASLALTLGFVLWTVQRAVPPGGGAGTGPLEPDAVQAVRFMVVAIAQSLAAYASFFAIPLALATFVGESENQTLELLLAAPVPDRQLYALKVFSVVLLGAGCGFALLSVFLGWSLWAHGAALARLPAWELPRLIALALPLPALYALVQVGLGACVSVRADSMKGAGQLLGGLYMLVFVGLGGTAIALGEVSEEGADVGRLLGGLEFWSYYWTSLAVPLIMGCVLLVIGGLLFRRERLLG